jgi:hypothetical protein
MSKQNEPLEPIKFFEPENFVFAFLGAVSAAIIGLMMFGTSADPQMTKSMGRNPSSITLPIDFEPLIYWSDLSSPK